MALNTNKNLKLYYTIKEVAQMFDLNEPTLRYWETVFPQLKPKTTRGNIRQYTEKDIEEVRAIHNLVKVRGFKLAAAKKMLSASRGAVDKTARIMDNLVNVRDQLKELKKQLDAII